MNILLQKNPNIFIEKNPAIWLDESILDKNL